MGSDQTTPPTAGLAGGQDTPRLRPSPRGQPRVRGVGGVLQPQMASVPPRLDPAHPAYVRVTVAIHVRGRLAGLAREPTVGAVSRQRSRWGAAGHGALLHNGGPAPRRIL